MNFISPVVFIIAAAVILLVVILASGYVKASTDEAFIITGLRKKPKVLIGRAGVKIPFLEKKDKLSLKLIPVEVTTSSPVPTADYINIMVDANVNVQVEADDPAMLETAARNFLNLPPQAIGNIAREVLEGNMREIVGRMHLQEMVTDRQKFGELVTQNAEPDLKRMGLSIKSFNVQNFSDNDDVIVNMGIDNVAQISKNASIAKANADRDVAIARAQAEKEANDARVAAETEIAAKQNELAIKQAELKQESDTKKAIADAAYQIQEEEQRKTIEATRVNADIAQQERTVELRQKEAEVMEQTLNAEIKKKADAEKYRRQQEAEAELIEKQRQADADKYEQQKDAEVRKIKADAEKEAKKKEAEGILAVKRAEAEGIAAVGEAEAKAIEAKGLAEAEAMEKKAEAYKKYTGAAMVEMIVNIMPQMAAEIAKPLASIDNVSIYGGGAGDGGVTGISNNVPVVMKQIFDTMSEATGVDFTEIMKANTYDAKVNKNITVNGIPDEVKVELPEAKQPVVTEKKIDSEEDFF